MLSEEERIRYSRQMLLEGWGEHGQQRLKQTRVLVVGAGGGGSPILLQLALLGIGTIRVCDFDTVDASNANRQFIHFVSDDSRLGVAKADSAKKTIQTVNPNVAVEVVSTPIDDDNIATVADGCELIFDCIDDFIPKFAISRYAVAHCIPHLIEAMVDLNSFACVLAAPFGPCFHCLFDVTKARELAELRAMSQTGTEGAAASPPPAVCCSSVILPGACVVLEAVKILLGIGEPAYDRFLYFANKGSAAIARSPYWYGITYWMTSYFRGQALAQGFDWDSGGWRDRYLEELIIPANPECVCCGSG